MLQCTGVGDAGSGIPVVLTYVHLVLSPKLPLRDRADPTHHAPVLQVHQPRPATRAPARRAAWAREVCQHAPNAGGVQSVGPTHPLRVCKATSHRQSCRGATTPLPATWCTRPAATVASCCGQSNARQDRPSPLSDLVRRAPPGGPSKPQASHSDSVQCFLRVVTQPPHPPQLHMSTPTTFLQHHSLHSMANGMVYSRHVE